MPSMSTEITYSATEVEREKSSFSPPPTVQNIKPTQSMGRYLANSLMEDYCFNEGFTNLLVQDIAGPEQTPARLWPRRRGRVKQALLIGVKPQTS